MSTEDDQPPCVICGKPAVDGMDTCGDAFCVDASNVDIYAEAGVDPRCPCGGEMGYELQDTVEVEGVPKARFSARLLTCIDCGAISKYGVTHHAWRGVKFVDPQDNRPKKEPAPEPAMPPANAAHADEALRRCFERARGSSGGESRVRRLLFAWWNASELGGFDLIDLWSLSDAWREDCLTVIAMVARGPDGWYADRYGFGDEMKELVEMYGPKEEER